MVSSHSTLRQMLTNGQTYSCIQSCRRPDYPCSYYYFITLHAHTHYLSFSHRCTSHSVGPSGCHSWSRFSSSKDMLVHIRRAHPSYDDTGGGGAAPRVNSGPGVGLLGGINSTNNKRLRSSNDADGNRHGSPDDEPTTSPTSSAELHLARRDDVEAAVAFASGAASGPSLLQTSSGLGREQLNIGSSSPDLSTHMSQLRDNFSKVDISFGNLVHVQLSRKLSM